MRHHILIYIILLFVPPIQPMVHAQAPARALSPQDYMEWVVRHHPSAVRADLLAAQSSAAEQAARGGFDPKLYADYEQKYFGGKDYYRVGEAGVKIPTWMGIEVKGSYQLAEGIYLNPENTLPADGQASIGLEIALLRGLIIDERRGSLRSAQLLAEANRAAGNSMLNSLLLEAGEAYWDWTVAYNNLVVQEEALAIAEARLVALVGSYKQGDIPAVDTLEAYLQVQARRFDLNQTAVGFRNAGVGLSNFLWLERQIPLTTGDSLRPIRWDERPGQPDMPELQAYFELLDERHPDILQYRFAGQQLEIDRRLAAEQLKPRLDLSFSLLGDGFSFSGNASGENGLSDWARENYKWGLTFEFPLFIRKERGKLQMNTIKQTDTELKLRQKRQELLTKIESSYNELLNLQVQIRLTGEMADNYARLLQAENRLFQMGESSVFLINSREQKLLEARLKQSELEGKLEKGKLKLEWAAGLLF